jgi:hypothetical protein
MHHATGLAQSESLLWCPINLTTTRGTNVAWSDAARRAAVLARRLKRVTRFDPKTSKQVDQQAYLTAKISQRLSKTRHHAKMQKRLFRIQGQEIMKAARRSDPWKRR